MSTNPEVQAFNKVMCGSYRAGQDYRSAGDPITKCQGQLAAPLVKICEAAYNQHATAEIPLNSYCDSGNNAGNSCRNGCNSARR